MIRKTLFVLGVIAILALTLVSAVRASSQNDLAKVRAATEKFRKIEAVQAAGYDLVSSLDHCFENGDIGNMGYHYINTASLDTSLDPLKPEAIVYAPTKDGELQLAAVEYIVPQAAWDEAGNTHPPELLGQHFHLNENLHVYVLHAWIWKHNPAGIFEDWNPNVSCPEE